MPINRYTTQFPVDYIFSWEEHTGYEAPWLIEDKAITRPEFYNAFALGILEKFSQGASPQPQILKEHTFSLFEFEFVRENNPTDYLVQIIVFYAVCWRSNTWLLHELYNADLESSYWDGIKDESVFTDDILKSYIGEELFDLIMNYTEVPYATHRIVDLADQQLWKALGVMWWMMRYRVQVNNLIRRDEFFPMTTSIITDEKYNPDRFEVTPVDFIIHDNLPNDPDLGSRFMIRPDSLGGLVEGGDSITGIVNGLPFTMTKGNIYEWIDITDYNTRKLGEPLSYTWETNAPVINDQVFSNVHWLKYDGSEWVLNADYYPQPARPSHVLKLSNDIDYNGTTFIHDTERPDIGFQSLAEARDALDSSLSDPAYDFTGESAGSTNGNDLFVQSFTGESVADTGADRDDNTDQYEDVRYVSYKMSTWSVGGGIAMYTTDILGTPIKADCIFPVELSINRLRKSRQDIFDDKVIDDNISVAMYDAYPLVSTTWPENDEPLLWPFDKSITLQENGWTRVALIVEGAEDVIANFTNFPLVDEAPFIFKSIGGSRISYHDSYNFRATHASNNIRGQPSTGQVVYHDTMLPDSKYFTGEVGPPQPLPEEEED